MPLDTMTDTNIAPEGGRKASPDHSTVKNPSRTSSPSDTCDASHHEICDRFAVVSPSYAARIHRQDTQRLLGSIIVRQDAQRSTTMGKMGTQCGKMSKVQSYTFPITRLKRTRKKNAGFKGSIRDIPKLAL